MRHNGVKALYTIPYSDCGFGLVATDKRNCAGQSQNARKYAH
jgi:hypothetical protein